MTPYALLTALAQDEAVDAPVALVVAHPDDETLGLGARLAHWPQLTLIHMTDGAPVGMGDARRAGCASREAYAAARAAELDAALEGLAARPVRRLAYGFTDQSCVDRLPELIDRLVADLRGQAAVLTHPYEGGHPDHDAAALAVQAACARLGSAAPVRLEFAGYHQGPHGPTSGVFPDGDPGEICRAEAIDLARKRAALDAHATQAAVLARFAGPGERLRLAPSYDFARPPPAAGALYDSYGWTLTSAVWRARAVEVLACA